MKMPIESALDHQEKATYEVDSILVIVDDESEQEKPVNDELNLDDDESEDSDDDETRDSCPFANRLNDPNLFNGLHPNHVNQMRSKVFNSAFFANHSISKEMALANDD